jgi:hypothetical protein
MLLAADVPVDKKAPYRIAAERIELTAEPTTVSACVARALGRSGNVITYPLVDGFGVDWGMRQILNLTGNEISTVGLTFRTDEKGRFATVLYRHPFSAKAALKVARSAGKTCFADDWAKWETKSK